MPVPLTVNSASIDLSQRFDRSVAVAGSPAAAAETIIATLTANTDETITEGVDLTGWAAFTVGTNGTAATLRLRQTDASGTIVASSGALTAVAAQLVQHSVQGFDATPGNHGQVYVLTLQITAGSAASTVSAVRLSATQV
jgi:hypothetical protein